MALKHYQKSEVIFREKDLELCMYEILSGRVGIYAHYDQENETLLTELKTGGVFGEMGLIDGVARSASAVALEDGTQLQQIDQESFQDYLASDTEKMLKIMQQMSNRIRKLTDDYLDACRAVAEAVEADDGSKEKSGWFKSHLKKFMDDYARYTEARAATLVRKPYSFYDYHR